MYQQIHILGNVGRDPELRYTSEGVPVASFSVAVNKRTKNGQDTTTWFKVTVWRGLAETCNQYVTKGMQVLCVGEVKADAYIGQDGTARASLEVTAQEVKFLGGGSGQSEVSESEEAYPF